MNNSHEGLEQGLLRLCNTRLRPKAPITAETGLLEQGLLDSLLVMDLVNSIEKQFGISIENAEISPRNFRTVRALAVLVASRLNGRKVSAELGNP